MGIFGPSKRQISKMAQEIAELERQQQAEKVQQYKNPPKSPLDNSVQWLVFDGGFLPTRNGALQHAGDLGVLFCAPSVPGDETASIWVRKMTPNVSVFVEGRAFRSALDDGWMGAAMTAHEPLEQVAARLGKNRVLFHYHFDLHPSEVSAKDIDCFNNLWVEFLKTESWDAFRRGLHSGDLPGAPAWWQATPLD